VHTRLHNYMVTQLHNYITTLKKIYICSYVCVYVCRYVGMYVCMHSIRSRYVANKLQRYNVTWLHWLQRYIVTMGH